MNGGCRPIECDGAIGVRSSVRVWVVWCVMLDRDVVYLGGG